jgi:prolyl-tRNA synthetase
MFAKWVQSYRDLPLQINQWANVVRWEMRTRLFLRTLEFLWQEGHTAHATHDEAEEETRKMLGVYRTFMEEWMAMPVVTGQKSESEKFAGALRTYSCEAMMQDNKALQAGTSHNLGQNFAKAFELQFQTEKGDMEFAWNTSWGVSTRMVGGLVMTHSDDNGLITPPRLAPIEIVIVPIWKSDEEQAKLTEAAYKLKDELTAWTGRGVHDRLRVHVDARPGMKPGAKYYEWELQGIPLRLELGPKDLEKGSVFSARRDTRAKAAIPMDGVSQSVATILDTIQKDLFAAALARREANTHRNVTSYEQFKAIMEGPGGFVYAGWNGDPASEAKVKEETKATIRVIPDAEFRSPVAPTTCLVTGEPAKYEVVWAKSY